MFQKSLIIHGFPRTGSTFVRGNLSQYFNVKIEQNHDITYLPPHEDFTAIVTNRRDIFSTLCSHFVMLHTNEMSIYTDTVFDQFEVSTSDFLNLFRAHRDFYKTIDLSCYKKVIEVWYEDVINDTYYLYGKFNLVEKTSYDFNLKCPHRYENLITNVDFLRDYFQKLTNDTHEA